MTAKSIPNDDEAAILTRADEIRDQRAAAARAALVEKYAPLVALRDSPAFEEVRTAARTLAADLIDQPAMYNSLTTLGRVMDSIDMVMPAGARPTA